MFIVPVIDLLHGQVVRAQRGDRAAYRPIVSALAAGSDPVRLAGALSHRFAARRLYAADLDALTGRDAQIDVIRALLRALPELELWLDAGFADAPAADRLRESVGSVAARLVPVFASESLHSRAALQRCAGRPGAILSLDCRAGERLDPAGCWDAPEHWPARVIVMTLQRVGSGEGPDLETLRSVQARSAAAEVFGAGGIRDTADLERAREAGAQGWLVASALHDGRLPPQRG